MMKNRKMFWVFEIHRAAREDDPITVKFALPSTSAATSMKTKDVTPPSATKRMLSLNSNWKNKHTTYSKVYPNSYAVEKRRNALIGSLSG